VKKRLIRAFRAAAGRWPRAAFWAARPLARGLQLLNRTRTDEWFAAVFPSLSPEARRLARRRSWTNHLRAEALRLSTEQAVDAPQVLPEIAPNPALDALRPPLIFASFHIGLLPALGSVMQRLPADVLVIHRGRYSPREGTTLMRRGENEWERARTLHAAVAQLRGGGFVFTALDGGPGTPSITAPMLGGQIDLARGVFALARMASAPIVPIAARDCGRQVVVATGEPISPDQGEEAMASAVVEWFAGYLLEFPGEVTPRLRLTAPSA
jgi:hypothetical protein